MRDIETKLDKNKDEDTCKKVLLRLCGLKNYFKKSLADSTKIKRLKAFIYGGQGGLGEGKNRPKKGHFDPKTAENRAGGGLRTPQTSKK